MGSKAQANASAKWASDAKKKGHPVRRTMQCPIGHTHAVTLDNLTNHLNNCPGPRRKKV